MLYCSILAIQTKRNKNTVFSFSKVSLKQIEKEISLFKLNKAYQYSDIPTKIIKNNSYIFLNFICEGTKNFIKFSILLSCLKHTDVKSC